ncbi:unnamed protein product [Prorocentrum cordatum]|uniref:Uncharacterized protein n=1 Tax=Prorocentrum cordatum TaxID=2364126 RepID=A0ABN9W5A5_9DINO|nr:unnamed protein product [Polarella glacialis]
MVDSMSTKPKEHPTLVSEFVESTVTIISLVNSGELNMRVGKRVRMTVESIIQSRRKQVIKLYEQEGILAKMKFKAIPLQKYLKDNPEADVKEDGLIIRQCKLPGFTSLVECVLLRKGDEGVFDLELTSAQLMSKEETLDDGSALIRQDQIDKRFRNLGEKVMQPLMKAAEKATQYKPDSEGEAGRRPRGRPPKAINPEELLQEEGHYENMEKFDTHVSAIMDICGGSQVMFAVPDEMAKCITKAKAVVNNLDKCANHANAIEKKHGKKHSAPEEMKELLASSKRKTRNMTNFIQEFTKKKRDFEKLRELLSELNTDKVSVPPLFKVVVFVNCVCNFGVFKQFDQLREVMGSFTLDGDDFLLHRKPAERGEIISMVIETTMPRIFQALPSAASFEQGLDVLNAIHGYLEVVRKLEPLNIELEEHLKYLADATGQGADPDDLVMSDAIDALDAVAADDDSESALKASLVLKQWTSLKEHMETIKEARRKAVGPVQLLPKVVSMARDFMQSPPVRRNPDVFGQKITSALARALDRLAQDDFNSEASKALAMFARKCTEIINDVTKSIAADWAAKKLDIFISAKDKAGGEDWRNEVTALDKLMRPLYLGFVKFEGLGLLRPVHLQKLSKKAAEEVNECKKVVIGRMRLITTMVEICNTDFDVMEALHKMEDADPDLAPLLIEKFHAAELAMRNLPEPAEIPEEFVKKQKAFELAFGPRRIAMTQLDDLGEKLGEAFKTMLNVGPEEDDHDVKTASNTANGLHNKIVKLMRWSHDIPKWERTMELLLATTTCVRAATFFKMLRDDPDSAKADQKVGDIRAALGLLTEKAEQCIDIWGTYADDEALTCFAGWVANFHNALKAQTDIVVEMAKTESDELAEELKDGLASFTIESTQKEANSAKDLVETIFKKLKKLEDKLNLLDVSKDSVPGFARCTSEKDRAQDITIGWAATTILAFKSVREKAAGLQSRMQLGKIYRENLKDATKERLDKMKVNDEMLAAIREILNIKVSGGEVEEVQGEGEKPSKRAKVAGGKGGGKGGRGGGKGGRGAKAA